MRCIWLAVFLCVLNSAWASEVSLIGKDIAAPAKLPAAAKPVLKEKSVTYESESGGFDQMQEFIRLENEKIKDIKLLNLDLERESLVLKKREIEAKLAKLNKSSGTAFSSHASGLSRPLFRLSGIFTVGSTVEALMIIDGAYMQVKKGQRVHEGTVVKTIGDSSVTLQGPDGKQTIVNLDV